MPSIRVNFDFYTAVSEKDGELEKFNQWLIGACRRDVGQFPPAGHAKGFKRFDQVQFDTRNKVYYIGLAKAATRDTPREIPPRGQSSELGLQDEANGIGMLSIASYAPSDSIVALQVGSGCVSKLEFEQLAQEVDVNICLQPLLCAADLDNFAPGTPCKRIRVRVATEKNTSWSQVREVEENGVIDDILSGIETFEGGFIDITIGAPPRSRGLFRSVKGLMSRLLGAENPGGLYVLQGAQMEYFDDEDRARAVNFLVPKMKHTAVVDDESIKSLSFEKRIEAVQQARSTRISEDPDV